MTYTRAPEIHVKRDIYVMNIKTMRGEDIDDDKQKEIMKEEST